MMEKFYGLILHFYKRQLHLGVPDVGSYDMILFGNYDGLRIRPIQKWQNFSPYAIHNHIAQKDRGDVENSDSGAREKNCETDRMDRYTAKLVMPPREFRERHRREFSYAPWMNRRAIEKADGERPLFAVILVNLTPVLYKDGKDSSATDLEIFARKLASTRGNLGGDYELALFRSIGYHDYAVLFRGSRCEDAYRITDDIRSYQEDGVRLVSSVHMILGMSARNDIVWADTGSYRFTLHIKYRFSMSLEEFDSAFHQAIEGSCLKVYGDFWQIRIESGESSCAVEINGIPSHVFLKEYQSGGIFTPNEEGSGFFNEYVIDLNTTIDYFPRLLKSAVTGNKPLFKTESEFGKENQNHEETLRHIKETLSKYREFANDNGRRTRLVSAFRQVVWSYENLTHSAHTACIRGLMDPIWDMLSDNIRMALCAAVRDDVERCRDIIEPVADVRGWLPADDELSPEMLDDMERELSRLRNSLGRYIQMLSSSDSLFMEHSQGNQSAIASAARLVFSLNYLLNRLVWDAKNIDDEHISQDYRILVISGGRDDTVARNYSQYVPILWNMDGNCSKPVYRVIEKRLLTILIPERSIYDMGGTIIRCCHEIWHYCGERRREARADAVLRSMSLFEADLMAELLLGEERQNAPVFGSYMPVHHTSLAVDKDSTDDFWEWLHAKYEEMKKCMVDRWTDEIYARCKEEVSSAIRDGNMSEKNGIAYYGDYYYEILLDAIANVNLEAAQYAEAIVAQSQNLQNAEKLDTTFFDAVMKIFFDGMSEYYSIIRMRLMEPENYIFAKRTEDMILYYTSASGENGNMIDIEMTKLVRDFMEGFSLSSSVMARSNRRKDDLRQAMSDTFDNLNIFFIWTVKDVCEEAYSDYMMCKTLRPEYGEYISSFLYEKWDLKASMPFEPAHVMRIGIVTELAYLTGENCSIDDLLENLLLSTNDGAGMLGHKEVYQNNLKKRLKQMWSRYEDFKRRGFVMPLLQYIKECDQPIFADGGSDSVRDARLIMVATRKNVDVNDYLDRMFRQLELMYEDIGVK